MPNAAYIYDHVRTPRDKGKPRGDLHGVKPIRLAETVLRAIRDRNNLNTDNVDDIVMGCGGPVGEQGGNLPKQAAQLAGYAVTTPAVQINRYCASGLEAVNMAAMRVASGWEDLCIGGGVDSLSRVPMGSDGAPMVQDPEMAKALKFVPQGIGADLIATIEGWTREDVDSFAAMSQERAHAAQTAGHFDNSVIPVVDEFGEVVLAKDSFIKPGTTAESLAGLKPSFAAMGAMGYDDIALGEYPDVAAINHVHHAGNSSGIVDGAAAMLVGSEKAGIENGLTARARIVATQITSTEPTIMLTGPGPAAKLCLAKAGLTVDDIDLFEINEAFASVALRFMKDLGIDDQRVNVNGGAIAMGHPIGATGCMILGTLLDEMERRDVKRGLAALCVGGGMGIATIIERV
jgi:acetyl-CoA C-acetyltransferase